MAGGNVFLSPPVNATVQIAQNASNATAETDLNATNASEAQTPVGSDAIVTHAFVQDVAAYLVARYLPAGTKRNPTAQSRFDLNVKSVNIRYGVDFPGLSVDPADTLGARKKIFEHVLQGPVIDFLHAAYTPLFLDSLEEALQATTHTLSSGQAAPITEAQRQEMLSLLSARLQGIGQVVSVLSSSDAVRTLVGRYLEDMDKVNQAHLDFWNLQTEKTSPAALDDASARIKTAIQNREISRQRLLQNIVALSSPQGMDASELIYLAQWVYRRGAENQKRLAMVGKIGDLLIRTAGAVKERSGQPMPAVIVDAGETPPDRSDLSSKTFCPASTSGPRRRLLHGGQTRCIPGFQAGDHIFHCSTR